MAAQSQAAERGAEVWQAAARFPAPSSRITSMSLICLRHCHTGAGPSGRPTRGHRAERLPPAATSPPGGGEEEVAELPEPPSAEEEGGQERTSQGSPPPGRQLRAGEETLPPLYVMATVGVRTFTATSWQGRRL